MFYITDHNNCFRNKKAIFGILLSFNHWLGHSFWWTGKHRWHSKRKKQRFIF